jgi:hypothetical protein
MGGLLRLGYFFAGFSIRTSEVYTKKRGRGGFCLKEKGIIMEYIYTNAENWTPWRW